jgi:hypothetical protein
VFDGTVLRYGIGSGILVIGFLVWALVKPKKYETKTSIFLLWGLKVK